MTYKYRVKKIANIIGLGMVLFCIGILAASDDYSIAGKNTSIKNEGNNMVGMHALDCEWKGDTSIERQQFLPCSNRPLKTKGVLDRFESNDKAVIILEDWGEELIVPAHTLPIGSSINTWFQLEKNHKGVRIVSIDWQATWKKLEQAKKMTERLRQ